MYPIASAYKFGAQLRNVDDWHAWSQGLGHWRADLESLRFDEERIADTMSELLAKINRSNAWRKNIRERMAGIVLSREIRLPNLSFDGLAASVYPAVLDVANATSTVLDFNLAHHLAWLTSTDIVHTGCIAVGRKRYDEEPNACVICGTTIEFPLESGPAGCLSRSTLSEYSKEYVLGVCTSCHWSIYAGRDQVPQYLAGAPRTVSSLSEEGDAVWLKRLVHQAKRLPSGSDSLHHQERLQMCHEAFFLHATHSDTGYLRALAHTASLTWYEQTYGSWFRTLVELGIVVGAQKIGLYGCRSLASDGHECNSLLELNVEQFLISKGIAHAKEPKYPVHPELNARGLLRADWKIGSVYVELLGLMSKVEYREKIERKRRLAAELSLQVIELLPLDLARMERIFGNCL